MTQEDKAKAYDEVREKISVRFGTNVAKEIFSEFEESKDERIRKALIEYFNEQCDMSDWNGVYGYQVVSWLEKQGQKLAWSEEDDRMLHTIIADFKGFSHNNTSTLESHFNECIDWLKTLKERVQPQTKQEWSKDDKVMLDDIIDFFENGTVKLQHDLSLYASWLKSLRPQNTWKPSDEQMAALKEVIDAGHYTSYPFSLETLYNDLKKLKEE